MDKRGFTLCITQPPLVSDKSLDQKFVPAHTRGLLSFYWCGAFEYNIVGSCTYPIRPSCSSCNLGRALCSVYVHIGPGWANSFDFGDWEDCCIAGGAQPKGSEPVWEGGIAVGPPYAMEGPSVIEAIEEAALFLKEGGSISEVAVARLWCGSCIIIAAWAWKGSFSCCRFSTWLNDMDRVGCTASAVLGKVYKGCGVLLSCIDDWSLGGMGGYEYGGEMGVSGCCWCQNSRRDGSGWNGWS